MVLREGSDWTAVCYGTMTGEVLAAAEALDAEGISVEVVKLNQLAPLEPETVLTVPKDGGDGRRDGKEDGTRKRKRNMKQQGTVRKKTASAG